MQPIKEIRFGLIKAKIFEKDTRAGQRHNVTVCRLYKNGSEWKESGIFGRDDLPVVAKVVDLAHTWIFVHQSSEERPQS